MIKLRPYQEEGLTAIWDYFAAGGKGNPLLCWPTGTGKSVVPAVFIQAVMSRWPGQRFLMITHVKELIGQNHDVLKLVWPNAPVGIYSAGLKQKDIAFPIIFGGIQSMVRNAAIFGHRDIIFIDEAHLISPEDGTMYQNFLATMAIINPAVKIIGMTATPFRMGQGMITDAGGIFTDIVHDITGVDAFNRLIAEGYLAPLIPMRTTTEFDVSNVGINKGEYIQTQLQAAVDKPDLVHKICTEMCHLAHNRRSWLIFASGIEHAEHIASTLMSFGIECAAVHSKQKPEYNDAAIKAFKENRLRAIANFGKLTTGFNHPAIDFIGMGRATLSVPLWVQMLGRGTRPEDLKENCLVADFGKNSQRLGPINDPRIPKRKEAGAGEMPVKICEACGVYNHTRVRFCINCGAEFVFQEKLVAKASTAELLRSDLPQVEMYNVRFATYKVRTKKDRPPFIQASYDCGILTYHEYLFPEDQKGYPKRKFKNWWMQRHTSDVPATCQDAMKFQTELRTPKRIRVWVNKKLPEVLAAEF